eukprot:3293672-Lingulodinium_polyedra.AAC.1
MPGDHAWPKVFLRCYNLRLEEVARRLTSESATAGLAWALSPFTGKQVFLGISAFVDDVGASIVAK